ncbi:MAG: CHASE2 domain-containing protein, partial [Nitrospirota bacterium]
MSGRSKDNLLRLLLGCLVILCVLALYLAQAFEGVERKTFDLRFKLRGPKPPAVPQVFLVGLDEETTRHFSVRPREFPRSLVAKAVKNLAAAGASVIALDFLYSQSSENPQEHEAMAEAMRAAGNVVLASFMSNDRYVPPLPAFQALEAGEGTINLTMDRDGIVRSLPVLSAIPAEEGVQYILNFDVETARLRLFGNEMEVFDPNTPGRIRINSATIVAPENELWVNYYGPPGTFQIFPLSKAV